MRTLNLYLLLIRSNIIEVDYGGEGTERTIAGNFTLGSLIRSRRCFYKYNFIVFFNEKVPFFSEKIGDITRKVNEGLKVLSSHLYHPASLCLSG